MSNDINLSATLKKNRMAKKKLSFLLQHQSRCFTYSCVIAFALVCIYIYICMFTHKHPLIILYIYTYPPHHFTYHFTFNFSMNIVYLIIYKTIKGLSPPFFFLLHFIITVFKCVLSKKYIREIIIGGRKHRSRKNYNKQQ
ncbi:hypothetical protein BD560DRAFT_166402 [Blakeslea trispora]|nr:hypothetical protein BD560DRAFT_166402 [Blakeslea trispora]